MPPKHAPEIITFELAQWRHSRSPVSLSIGTLSNAAAFALTAAQGLVYLGFITQEQSLELQLQQWLKKYRSPLIEPSEPLSLVDCLARPWVLVGSAFQHRVWQELLAIPRGQTTSYKALATAINCPKGFQAVGRAVGANPLSVLIPCHRVIGLDGGLTGYHWGLALKKQLLLDEGAMKPNDAEKLAPNS